MSRYQNNHFALFMSQDLLTTTFRMEVFGDIVSTHHLPATYQLLKFHLPSILRSKCFNQNSYPFFKEVRKTEIGHLFEHILLEYLCIEKTLIGIANPVHNGLTSWNWQEEKWGVFHINVDVGQKDSDAFLLALRQTIELTTKIMQTGATSTVPVRLPLEIPKPI